MSEPSGDDIAPAVVIRKRVRMKQKEKEYIDTRYYSTGELIGHLIAEVGKMTHALWHSGYGAEEFKNAFVDVSNLHDMVLERAKKEWG